MNKIIEKVTTIWRKIPRAIRSAWVTAWVTFTATILSILTGLLPVVANAISTKNWEPVYNSLDLGLAAAISAALGFLSGLVNGIYRWLRPIEEAYKLNTPPDA